MADSDGVFVVVAVAAAAMLPAGRSMVHGYADADARQAFSKCLPSVDGDDGELDEWSVHVRCRRSSLLCWSRYCYHCG